MSFSKKSLKESHDEISGSSIVAELLHWKYMLMMFCVAGITFVGGYVWSSMKEVATQAGVAVMKASSQALGIKAKSDTLGKINVVLAGYAGEDAMGGLLTDSLMIVSYDPNINAASFISVPRDLFVSYGTGQGAGKINGLLWHYYLNGSGTEAEKLHRGAMKLMTKIGEITGIEPSYYGLVNFDGFVSLIDSIGGVEVDVPERLYDTEFPDDNYKGFITLDVPAGKQTMDGKLALRYARSRHSTSDFSRSARQQLIMKAVIDKLVGEMNITNISNLKSLFTHFSDVVKSNVNISDLVAILPHIVKERHMFNFVLSADCNNFYLETTQPGCVLYNADRNLFGGAATILPLGAGPGKVSYYKYTQDFGKRITEHQDMLIEKAALTIINNIDKNYAQQSRYPIAGLAKDLAIDLKEKGFLIDDIQGTVATGDQTILYVSNPDDYKATIKLLEDFMPIDSIETGSTMYADMTLSLGNSYVDYLKAKANAKAKKE